MAVPEWTAILAALEARGISDPVLQVCVLAMYEIPLASGARVFPRFRTALGTVAAERGSEIEELSLSYTKRSFSPQAAEVLLAEVRALQPRLQDLPGAAGPARYDGWAAPAPAAAHGETADPRAPWEVFGEAPMSLRWRMGPGEDLLSSWLRFWDGLAGADRRGYLTRHPPPPVWEAWLRRLE